MRGVWILSVLFNDCAPVFLDDRLIIRGGVPLRGEISSQGAKNSALPILAAAVLCDSQVVLHNCPNLTDCDAAVDILRHLGCKVKRERDTVIIDPPGLLGYEIPEELMLKMRSSIVFLGAVLSKRSKARLSYPGGCELGARPIDLHLSALKLLGADIKEEDGYLDCSAKKGLTGAEISLGFPSVGATENIVLAAVCAKGVTTIHNAAQEPEVADLIAFLNKCGAKIYGAGESKIVINGVERLRSAEYEIMGDRIADATYLCMAAATKGSILIKKANSANLSSVLPILRDMGCDIKSDNQGVYINAENRTLSAVKTIKTMPYPGFPTDAQPPLMAAMCTASGCCIFVENIFDNRFKHAGELVRMGADIKVEGRVAVVTGAASLHAAQTTAYDLRAGAAVITAALAANGESSAAGMCHVDRGYECIENSLCLLGADVKRLAKPE